MKFSDLKLTKFVSTNTGMGFLEEFITEMKFLEKVKYIDIDKVMENTEKVIEQMRKEKSVRLYINETRGIFSNHPKYCKCNFCYGIWVQKMKGKYIIV